MGTCKGVFGVALGPLSLGTTSYCKYNQNLFHNFYTDTMVLNDAPLNNKRAIPYTETKESISPSGISLLFFHRDSMAKA